MIVRKQLIVCWNMVLFITCIFITIFIFL